MSLLYPFHIFGEIIESDPSDIECECTIDTHPCDIRKWISDDNEKFLYREAEIEKWGKYEDAKVSTYIMIDMSFSYPTEKMGYCFFHNELITLYLYFEKDYRESSPGFKFGIF